MFRQALAQFLQFQGHVVQRRPSPVEIMGVADEERVAMPQRIVRRLGSGSAGDEGQRRRQQDREKQKSGRFHLTLRATFRVSKENWSLVY